MTPTYVLAAVDLVAVLVLAMAVYYPRHRRADLVTAFIAANVGVLRTRRAAAQGATRRCGASPTMRTRAACRG